MNNEYRRIKPANAIQYDGTQESVSVIYDWIREVYGKGNEYMEMPVQIYEHVGFAKKGSGYRSLTIRFYENSEPIELRKSDWLVNQNNSNFQLNRFSIVSDYDFKRDFEPVQPTTNCSQLEQTFRAKIIPPEDFPDREWTVRKGQDIVAFFKENGLHEIINTSFTPLELRQLADLVEETLKGNE